MSKLQSSIDSGCGSVTLVPTVATLSIAQPSRRGSRPHIGLMPHLDLCDDETAAPPRATAARRRRSAVPLLAIVADNQQKTTPNKGLRAENTRGFKDIHRSPSRAAILRATARVPPTRRVWLTSITIASPSPSRWRAGRLRPADGSSVYSATGNTRQCGPVRWVRYSLGRSFLAALPLKRTARHQRCTTLS